MTLDRTSGQELVIDRRRVARHLLTAAGKILVHRNPQRNLRKVLTLLGMMPRSASAPLYTEDTEVEAQRCVVRRPLSEGPGPVCLLVTYSPDGRLWPHLVSYARSLRATGCRVVLIATTERTDLCCEDPGPDVVDAVVVRENHGLDFAAWTAVLRLWPWLWETSALWFANDSVYHSPGLFPAFADYVKASTADVVAATGSNQIEPHFQSYFFVLKSGALARRQTRAFFDSVRALVDKDEVIRSYEVKLESALEAAGNRVDVFYAPRNKDNPTMKDWRRLNAAGLPFVKVQLLRDNPSGVDLKDWRGHLAQYGFEPDEVQLHLGSLGLRAAALLAF
ncbi:rhamnan synthesis F family protein [Xanthobacter variabilis]|uniref:rhamnan synthesis F family protein n=1 Tax=Xanthobacter variabilis TaxID=3119932 RepID=UPI00374EE7D2